MYGKASFSLILLISLIFLSLILFSTTDLRSHLSPFLLLSTPTPSTSPCHPLKVYMYDLPRRFNIAMMLPKKSEVDDDTSVTEKTLPMWPYRFGLRRQHSVEYWMMASLLWDGEEGGGEGEGEGREVVRVSDPGNADVFFVPFFSSLSFNTHGHTMTDPETEVDRQLQSLSNLRKDVVSPYVHAMESYTDDDASIPFESRTTLLFFRGRTVRKDEGKVRAILGKVLANYTDVHYESSFASDEGIRLSSEAMCSSKFCLHHAGDTPSSCRLFDAIVSHCVPVIVSDHIELPYEDEIDYSQFSIFFSFMEASKPGYMVDQLRQVPKDTWVKMWQRLKEVSHHFEFQYPPKKEDAVDMLLRQVSHKLPAVNLAVHRSRRLKIPDWWSQRR
ncbi:putative arabinosyltransferase ARAD2 [Drosera capensis]